LEHAEQFAKILDRHIAVDHGRLAISRHDDTRRPVNVETGEPLELRGHHHERLG